MPSRLTFSEYQRQAFDTAIYPNRGRGELAYPTLGLNGEAGEAAEKVKKILRDQGGQVDDDSRQALAKELGDVLWYVAALCSELGLDLQAVAEDNIAKLQDRKARQKLHGSGDER